MRTRPLLALVALAAITATRSAAAGAALFADDFAAYKALTDVAANWDLSSGWQLSSGALAATNSDRAIALASACPEIISGEIRATLAVQSRARRGGWAAAGLMLYQGPDDYWRLALVESPAGEHYCELVEQQRGIWQAQSAGRTELAGETAVTQPWAFGAAYELVIILRRDSITGEVRASGGGHPTIFSRTYRFAAPTPAVQSGRAALEAIAVNAAFDDVAAGGESPAAARGLTRSPSAAVLSQPGGEEIARLTTRTLRQAQYEVQPLAATALADAQAFNRARFDVLVLPRVDQFPGPAMRNMLAFLRAGGHLIAFGGVPFETLLWRYRGKWMPAANILSQIRADKPIVDFKGADLTQWTRASSNPTARVEYKLVGGPEGRSALRVKISDLRGWETFGSPALSDPFPGGRSLTCFWAKGGRRTDYLTIEWNERDGSRWIAAVEIGREWRRYALRPDDFKYWRDSPAKDRGGPGDVFDPQNAARIIFGLAQSHAAIPNGAHEFWVADVGAAASPLPATSAEPPTLEGMSPWYKVYEVEVGPKDRVALESDLFPPGFRTAPLRPELSGSLVSPIWRQRGLGRGVGQRGRWIPLVRIWSPPDKYRGVAASTYLATSGPYRGATWTYIGLNRKAVVANWHLFDQALGWIAERLADGLLLASGGADQFCYFAEPVPGETPRAPRLVAQVLNIGARPRTAQVRFLSSDATSPQRFDQTMRVDIAPGAMATAAVDCGALSVGRYSVTCRLLPQEPTTRLDSISSEFSVVAPAAKPQFITAHGGDFYLGGQKWYPHGLNFWPLYVAGLERGDYWLHWLSPAQYDPEAVERDLTTLASIGVNLVSIQYGNADQAPALNHFFERAKARGIHVNVFIPGTHPLMMDLAGAEALIRAARLADSDAMFAYDLAWEPIVGGEQQRHNYDAAWATWVADNYGTIEAAERDWGFALPRLDGKPTGPSDVQLTQDGPHRRMVAAYRRFTDDLISQGYGQVARLVRRLDPHHLFGARTGYGGTGQRGVVAAMPFDLVAGAAHLDFASAEGWGLWGEWRNFEPAGFTTLYGRWATGGKPVFWAEFGYTIYPGTTPERYLKQAEVYRNMYRMVLESGANGSTGWWFPGGLRVDENSDYGVVSPDGTPRPAAEELRKAAARIKAPRDRPQPDAWITIDRDAEVSGYAGVWERGAGQYLAALRAGKKVGLRTEADSTDSASTPLVAVGDVPCNGSNPPKYLNGEFGEVFVVGADGQDMAVTDGAVVEVARGKPVVLRAQVINTGVAAWLSPQSARGRAGAVYVGAGQRGGLEARVAIARDVPRYGATETEGLLTAGVDERTEVTLAMLAEGRAWFGQRLRFTLVPR